jgi:hypothetical protein
VPSIIHYALTVIDGTHRIRALTSVSARLAVRSKSFYSSHRNQLALSLWRNCAGLTMPRSVLTGTASFVTSRLARVYPQASLPLLPHRCVCLTYSTFMGLSRLKLILIQMYWALENLYSNSATIHFDEQHFRGVWSRYFRALIKLPHLGRLRIDMLDRIK